MLKDSVSTDQRGARRRVKREAAQVRERGGSKEGVNADGRRDRVREVVRARPDSRTLGRASHGVGDRGAVERDFSQVMRPVALFPREHAFQSGGTVRPKRVDDYESGVDLFARPL